MQNSLLLSVSQVVIDTFTAHKTLIASIFIGMACGLIAQLIVPGRGHGLVTTVLIGIAGCYLSNMFLVQYITIIDNHIVREFVGALVGSMIVLILVNLVMVGQKKDKAKVR